MENQFGKTSLLKFRTINKNYKTILSDVSFTAPFKIIPPFEKPDGGIEVMPLMASAGIMEGDRQEHDIGIGEHSNVKFSSQSFEKVHKMQEGCARRNVVIKVASNAFFDYSPLPVIPFADSTFESTMLIELADDNSRFLLSEIISCGRAAYGERFQYHSYRSLVEIYKGGKLVYRDNTYYNPKMFPMEDIAFYEGYTHLANMVVCNIAKNDKWIDKVRVLMDEKEGVTGAVTNLQSKDIVVRILGQSAQVLQDMCEMIKEL